MPLLLLIFGILTPRLVLIVIALFTNWISMAFSSILWPILGWFLMPYTTLAYMGAMIYNNHQISGAWLVLLVVAVVIDLGSHGGTYRLR